MSQNATTPSTPSISDDESVKTRGTVLSLLETNLNSALASISRTSEDKFLIGSAEDVRNFLLSARSVSCNVNSNSSPPSLDASHSSISSTEPSNPVSTTLEITAALPKLYRVPTDFHVRMSAKDDAPLCQAQINLSVRSKRSRPFLVDTAKMFAFEYLNGSGQSLIHESIKGSLHEVFLIVSSDTARPPPIHVTYSSPHGLRHTIVQTLTVGEALQKFTFSSSHLHEKYQSVDTSINQLELFPRHITTNEVAWHTIFTHGLAVQVRWNYAIITSVKDLRASFSSYFANNFFSETESTTAERGADTFEKYVVRDDALSHRLNHFLHAGRYIKFSENNLNIHNVEQALGNEVTRIIAVVLEKNEDIAIGVPGLSKLSILIRRKRDNEATQEQVSEAAGVLQDIAFHKDGGQVKRHKIVQISACFWVVMSICVSVCAAIFNWGNHIDSIFLRVTDCFNLLTLMLLTMFALIKATNDQEYTFGNALHGIKVFRGIQDVQRYYHRNVKIVPFGLAVCATTEKLQWLDHSHTCYLENRPTGSITFNEGVYVPHLRVIGMLVGKQATLHYGRGKSTLNSANEFSYVIHMDRKLTASDLFRGEITIVSGERLGDTYHLA